MARMKKCITDPGIRFRYPLTNEAKGSIDQLIDSSINSGDLSTADETLVTNPNYDDKYVVTLENDLIFGKYYKVKDTAYESVYEDHRLWKYKRSGELFNHRGNAYLDITALVTDLLMGCEGFSMKQRYLIVKYGAPISGRGRGWNSLDIYKRECSSGIDPASADALLAFEQQRQNPDNN